MKKIIATVLAVATCFAMVGCNKDKKGGSSTLWLTVEDSQAELTLHVKLANAFIAKKKAEGQTVVVKRSTVSTNDYGKGISTLFATDTLGDVIFTYDTYAAQYSENKMFENLDDYIKRDNIDLSLYDQTIVDSARAYGTELSYFPRSYDQVTIFINNKFFQDMGMEDKIPAPKDNGKGELTWDWWTWSELLSLCGELRTAIDSKMSEAAAAYYYPMDANLLWNAVYDPILKSFGGYTVDVTAMDSGFNKDNADAYAGTINGLNFMKDLIAKGYTPGGYGAFTAGKNAMAFQTRPSVSSAMDANMELSFAPVPTFDTGIEGITEDSTSYVGYGSAGYALNKNSTKKDLAWDFIKFAISEEGQAITAGEGRCIPTIRSQLKADGAWTGILKDKDGKVIDQSAFLDTRNTLSLATYARGVKTDTEYQIYSKVRQNILGQLAKKSAESTASYLYTQISTYIKK